MGGTNDHENQTSLYFDPVLPDCTGSYCGRRAVKAMNNIGAGYFNREYNGLLY